MEAVNWQRNFEEVQRQRDELIKIRDEFEGLELLLTELKALNAKECLIPICGSNMVLCPGQIINTNSVLCQLSKDLFVKRTVANCIDKTLKPRKEMAECVLKDHENQLRDLQTKIRLSHQPSSPFPEAPPSRGGTVNINSDGFYEILEREDKPQPPTAQPLIQEVKSKSILKEPPRPTESEAPPRASAQGPPRASARDPVLGEVVEKEPTGAVPRAGRPASSLNSGKSIFAQELDNEFRISKSNRQ